MLRGKKREKKYIWKSQGSTEMEWPDETEIKLYKIKQNNVFQSISGRGYVGISYI